MKNMRIGVALVALGVMLGGFASTASATRGGDEFACPAGIEWRKYDNLSGATYTVPTPPAGWYVTGVVVKAGPEHYTYAPVTPGQVIQVKQLTGHDVSHVHVCKAQVPSTTLPPTTVPPTTVPPTTLPPETTAPTTTVPVTTVPVTTVPVTTTPPTTVVVTTVPPSTAVTTTTPATTVPPTVLDTTVTTAPSTTVAPAVVTNLPRTGSNTATIAWIASALLVLGGIMTMVRRPRSA